MTHVHNAEPVEGSFVPRPVAGLVSITLDGELLLLDPRTDGLHQLDRLGALIWSVLDGVATVDELVDDLVDAFGASPGTVRHDLGQLLAALRTAGAFEGAGPRPDLLTGAGKGAPAGAPGGDDLWRPDYMVDPPAP